MDLRGKSSAASACVLLTDDARRTEDSVCAVHCVVFCVLPCSTCKCGEKQNLTQKPLRKTLHEMLSCAKHMFHGTEAPTRAHGQLQPNTHQTVFITSQFYGNFHSVQSHNCRCRSHLDAQKKKNIIKFRKHEYTHGEFAHSSCKLIARSPCTQFPTMTEAFCACQRARQP